MINPIQKLYLLSLYDNKVWNTRNVLVCLIHESVLIKKIIFKDNKFKIESIDNLELVESYIERFIILIKNNMYYELKNFIDTLNFKLFAENNGYIRIYNKKGLFKKEVIEKTIKFNEEIKDIMNNDNYIKILTNNVNINDYVKLSEKIISKIKELSKD